MTKTSPHYAGFWIRFAATLIDNIIFLAIVIPLLVWIYGVSYFGISYFYSSNTRGFADIFLNYIFPILATILFWKYQSATPGKLLFSLIIVDADTLQKPTTSQLVIRFFAYLLSFLPLCIGFFWIAFDRRKQGWHDKLAKTVVIYKP